MADLYEFPTDFDDESDGTGALGWTASVIAAATLGLALLNPGAISGWLDDLPPGPRTATLVAGAEAWRGALDRVGLGMGHAKLHAAWKAAERADWSGRQPVEMADASGPRS